MRSTSLHIFLFFLLSVSAQAQLLELRFLEADIEKSLASTGKKDLTMYVHLNEYGFPTGPFRIEQSFEFNPGYRTVRVKGKLKYGILTDSIFVYNDRAQMVETGFFNPVGEGKYDSLSGYYHGVGLMGIREGKFTYYKSGKGYKDYKLDHTIEFKDGYKDGKEIYYYPDGLDYQVKTWKRDTLHGLYVTKFSTGDTLFKVNYVNGKKEGFQIRYHHNGKVKDTTTYSNGIQNGIESHYYSNGQLKERLSFKDYYFSYLSPYHDSLGKEIPRPDESNHLLSAEKVEIITDNMWPNFQIPEDIPNYYGYYITKKEYRFLKKFKNEEIQVEFKKDTISSLTLTSKPKKTKKTLKAESNITSILNRELALIHTKSENGVLRFQITNLMKKSPMMNLMD